VAQVNKNNDLPAEFPRTDEMTPELEITVRWILIMIMGRGVDK